MHVCMHLDVKYHLITIVGGSRINMTIGSSALDVTLMCPVQPCTIRYGLDPTYGMVYQTLPFEGRSGEPLHGSGHKEDLLLRSQHRYRLWCLQIQTPGQL